MLVKQYTIYSNVLFSFWLIHWLVFAFIVEIINIANFAGNCSVLLVTTAPLTWHHNQTQLPTPFGLVDPTSPPQVSIVFCLLRIVFVV